jgi:hypothetical protein
VTDWADNSTSQREDGRPAILPIRVAFEGSLGFAYVGSGTKMSVGDAAWVIGFAHLGFITAYLYSALAVLIARLHPNQLKLPIWLALIVVWICFGSLPIGAFFGGKMGRSLCSRWRKRLQRDPSPAEIKRILNLIAFAITLVAGALQLLNVFS